MNKAKVTIGAVVALVVLVLGGTWVYINVIKEDAPERLTLDTASDATTTTGASNDTAGTLPAGDGSGVDGTWTATSDSVVGYRVKEVLFGQDTEGVGRTNKVTGSITIDGTSVTAADFTVDMTSLESDESRRDAQFNGRIMNTSKFPEATFELTSPIDLSAIPEDGVAVTAKATGDLTLKGTTKSVELDISATRTGDSIETLSTYDVVFADWGIDNPGTGPITTEDHGLLEIKLVFTKG